VGGPSAVITLERGDISPSLNMTCLHATREEGVENAYNDRRKRETTHANGVCKSRLESDSVPSPSSSLSNLSMSISSISKSGATSRLPSGKLNFLIAAGLEDEVRPRMAEGALDLCGRPFDDGAPDLDCSLDDELDSSDDFLRRGFGVSDMMARTSGLVRPLVALVGESLSLLGKG